MSVLNFALGVALIATDYIACAVAAVVCIEAGQPALAFVFIVTAFVRSIIVSTEAKRKNESTGQTG